MRRDAPPSGPELGEEVGQFMTERPIDFGRAMGMEPRVERNERPPGIGPPGTSAEPGIPLHLNLASQCAGSEPAEKRSGHCFQCRVASSGMSGPRRHALGLMTRIEAWRIEGELELLRGEHGPGVSSWPESIAPRRP